MTQKTCNKAGFFSLVLSVLTLALISAANAVVIGQTAEILPVAELQVDNTSRNYPRANLVHIESVQRLLARLGMYRGEITGDINADTSLAVSLFCKSQNISSSNCDLTPQLVTNIRTTVWKSRATKNGLMMAQEKLLDSVGIREMQQYLFKLDINPGPIDGTFGPLTQTGVEQFQANEGTSVDGLVTKNTLMNVKRAALNPERSSWRSEVRILNWSDYIDPDVLSLFESENHVRVIYDIFGSNEDLEAKLKLPGANYDVIVPTGNTIQALASKNLIQALDKSKLPNLNNIDQSFVPYIESWDAGAKYSVPYMWYTIGIASNKKLVDKYAPGVDVQSLASIFDPVNARKLKGCGIAIEDSSTDMIPLAAIYSGIQHWDNASLAVASADAVLKKIKGIVKVVPSDEFIQALSTGRICIALGFSGDAIQARKSATAGTSITYRVPNEGSTLVIDMLAIPASSRNSVMGYKFVDFMLRPDIIARVSKVVSYANANAKSDKYMPKELLNDPGVIPPAEVFKRLITIPPLSIDHKQKMENIWHIFSGE